MLCFVVFSALVEELHADACGMLHSQPVGCARQGHNKNNNLVLHGWQCYSEQLLLESA